MSPCHATMLNHIWTRKKSYKTPFPVSYITPKLNWVEFFEVHKAADVYHRESCEKLLDDLSSEEQKKAEVSALSTAKYLWNFLSGIAEKHSIPRQVAA